jgi:hypothetical protein
MQRWPSHQADDIGEMLKEPFSFSEVSRRIGVPQYKIAGEIVVCIVG